MHEPTWDDRTRMNAKGLDQLGKCVPIIMDIRPRRGPRAPSELVRGLPSWHPGPNRNPGGSVVNGGEVAQKAMQIDNGFLRGDAKQGVNEGTLTEYIAFRQQRTCPLWMMCIASYLCNGESPHFGPIYQFAMHRLTPEPLQEVDAWLAPFRRLWSAHVDALERHLDRMEQRTPTKRKIRRRR